MQTENDREDDEFGLGFDISYVPKVRAKKNRTRTDREVENSEKTRKKEGDSSLQVCTEQGEAEPGAPSSACTLCKSRACCASSSTHEEALPRRSLKTSSMNNSLTRKKTVYEMERDEKIRSILEKSSLDLSSAPSSGEVDNELPQRNNENTNKSLNFNTKTLENSITSSGSFSSVSLMSSLASFPGESGKRSEGERNVYFRGRGGRGGRQDAAAPAAEERQGALEGSTFMGNRGRGRGEGRGRGDFQESFTTATPMSPGYHTNISRQETRTPPQDPRYTTFRLNQRRLRNALVEVDPESFQPLLLYTAPGSHMVLSNPSSFPLSMPPHQLVPSMIQPGRGGNSSRGGGVGFRGNTRGRGSGFYTNGGEDAERERLHDTRSSSRFSFLPQHQQQQRGNASIATISSKATKAYRGIEQRGCGSRGGGRWPRESAPLAGGTTEVPPYGMGTMTSNLSHNSNDPSARSLYRDPNRNPDMAYPSSNGGGYITRGKRSRE